MTSREKSLVALAVVTTSVSIVLWWESVSEKREADSRGPTQVKDLSAELAALRSENSRLSKALVEAQSRSKPDAAERSRVGSHPQFALLADLQ